MNPNVIRIEHAHYEQIVHRVYMRDDVDSDRTDLVALFQKSARINGQVVTIDLSTIAEFFKEEALHFYAGDMQYAILRRQIQDSMSYSVGEALWATRVDSVREFFYAIKSAIRREPVTLEFQLGGIWYPITIKIDHHTPPTGGEYAVVGGIVHMVDAQFSRRFVVTSAHFHDEEHKVRSRSIADLIVEEGWRIPQLDMKEYQARCRRAAQMLKMNGTAMDAVGNGIQMHSFLWMQNLRATILGTPSTPRRVILESVLETKSRDLDDDDQMPDPVVDFPFLRIFDLVTKEYMYVDESVLHPATWDARAMEHLVLPPNFSTILKQIFTTDTSALFGDIMANKHGGMIILACGKPGVGKTNTAEVFAEHNKRPLYCAEIGEMGLTLESIEHNLRRIFARVTRWNAVLLLDEADIFLAARDNNLERSAIVGVFLRLLDYYAGVLFLTTNRSSTIDEAFRSRITLKLNYPDLDQAARRSIWASMLQRAGITLTGDLDAIATQEMNGRQIRNMVRLLKVLHPVGTVTTADVLAVCEFTTH